VVKSPKRVAAVLSCRGEQNLEQPGGETQPRPRSARDATARAPRRTGPFRAEFSHLNEALTLPLSLSALRFYKPGRRFGGALLATPSTKLLKKLAPALYRTRTTAP